MNESNPPLRKPRRSYENGGRNFETLHYELAAQVRAVRDKLPDTSEALGSLATEVRTPKPVQWTVFATVAGTAVGFLVSIGGLIHSNLIQRIDANRADFEHADKIISERVSEVDARHTRREDEIKMSVVTRAEDGARPPYVSKAEFDTAVTAILARVSRNEGYIEEARKAETVHTRINQLYELYRQLQTQQTQLSSHLDPQRK